MADQDDSGPTTRPYQALLLLSFGGPEQPADVVPFLENVTRGRGIPRERLEQVGEHYYLLGGRSPINDQNRALLSALRQNFTDAGIDLPIYWGNRNWTPYLTDVVREMAADGIERAAVITTSAYSSWSSCRQYRENLEEAVAGVSNAPVLDKIRPYYNHPGFISVAVDRAVEGLAELPDAVRSSARLVFVTHSIPSAMDENSGPHGGAYRAQHEDIAAEVTARAEARTGERHPHDLVFCSRSGSPRTPWLEPDINDHLEALAERGEQAVVMIPVGFVSDHMEVIYDLDTEAMTTAKKVGIAAVRAGTAGVDPRFVTMIRELFLERVETARGEQPQRPAVGSLGVDLDWCSTQCCLASEVAAR